MNSNVTLFLGKIRGPALAIELETGIPWKFAATQAAHESRYGLSKLTLEANNLFGITGDSWKAKGLPVYEITTLEYDSHQVPYTLVRPFRRYASWEDSLRDWADLLRRLYPKALAAAKDGDFVTFANALQQGGYATDPKYAVQLIAMNQSLEDVG
jgi:flagellar protein FlgJ